MFYQVNSLFLLQLLEAEIVAHQDRVDDINAQVRTFRDDNHFLIAQIEDKGQALVRRLVSRGICAVCLCVHVYV